MTRISKFDWTQRTCERKVALRESEFCKGWVTRFARLLPGDPSIPHRWRGVCAIASPDDPSAL